MLCFNGCVFKFMDKKHVHKIFEKAHHVVHTDIKIFAHEAQHGDIQTKRLGN